jgi:hypothetical protein
VDYSEIKEVIPDKTKLDFAERKEISKRNWFLHRGVNCSLINRKCLCRLERIKLNNQKVDYAER